MTLPSPVSYHDIDYFKNMIFIQYDHIGLILVMLHLSEP